MFKEKLSPFLKAKMDALARQEGLDSPSYLGLARQYLRDDREDLPGAEASLKHYEAHLEVDQAHGPLHGLERLYRRTMVIEPTLACAAHCRYCLRSNYPKHTLSEEQVVEVAKYCGHEDNRTVNEVLITGGDPLLIPRRLHFLVEALLEHAPNIKIFRIATRLVTQDPGKIDEQVFKVFKDKPGVRLELATQINHPAEFFPESRELFAKFRQLGVKVYSQNVLLKGVNDDPATLAELYDLMRQNDIEPHYLFHCIPLKGIGHLRTSVDKGLTLIKDLVAGGMVSGRAKPILAAMTDIGKIVFYEGTIRERKDGWLLLHSHYRLADRMAWNPSWRLPPNAQVDEDGYLQVWYLDGGH
jgi:lysine 2,3-aminomutase